MPFKHTQRNPGKKRLRVVALGGGILPVNEFYPVLQEHLKKEENIKGKRPLFLSVDKTTHEKNFYSQLNEKYWHKFKSYHLWHDNYKFLQGLKPNSVDVFSILMPVDLLDISFLKKNNLMNLKDFNKLELEKALLELKKAIDYLSRIGEEKKQFRSNYFKLLDKVLRPNGEIIFLSENLELAESIKEFFLKKGYELIENERLKKEIIKRSYTARFHDFPTFSNLKFYAFILKKKALK